MNSWLGVVICILFPRRFYDLVKMGKPLSPQNEMLAVQMIRRVCLTLLNDYRNKRGELVKNGTISLGVFTLVDA